MEFKVSKFLLVLLVLVDMSSSAEFGGQRPEAVADKIAPLRHNGISAIRSENEFNLTRSPLLDSLFNIPIQTIRAVNDLIQSIAGNLQTMGGLRRPERKPELIFSERRSRRLDDDE